MSKETLIIHVDDEAREVTVGSAHKADSIRRNELMLIATRMEDTEVNKNVAFFLYPSCVASVREPEDVRNMSFQDFLTKVDETDIDTWLELAYKHNPQWRTALEALSRVGAEEAEKKIGTPLNGSSTPTEESTKTTAISQTSAI